MAYRFLRRVALGMEVDSLPVKLLEYAMLLHTKKPVHGEKLMHLHLKDASKLDNFSSLSNT